MSKRLHPSSAAFVWEGTVVTEYSSGCLRYILISANGIRTPIPEEYMRVGAAHEEMYAAELTAKGVQYEREVKIRIPISTALDVDISGRIDFVIAPNFITETKGTISKNTRLKVLRKGEVKINQLAQLVSYLIARQASTGQLVTGYYEETEDNVLVLKERRDFLVRIAEDGGILIDGVPSMFTVYDQLAHRTLAAEVLETNRIADRPDNWHLKYGGPCGFCAFKDTCDKYDAGAFKDLQEFLAAATIDAEIAAINTREPVPNKVKVKKQRKEKT